MTPKDVYQKCTELLRTVDLPELVDQEFMKVVKNGNVEPQKHKGDSCHLAKIILSTVFTELTEKFNPGNPESLIEPENLRLSA